LTALVIEVPAAQVLLDAASRVNPALVRAELPAHVTALYPFLPADELGDDVDEAVRGIAASMPLSTVRLTKVVTAPGFVGVRVPELQPVADAACARWPEVLPYGGRFGPKPPVHVTVAMGASEDEVARVAEQARLLLPLEDEPAALRLAVLTEQGWVYRLTAGFGQAGGTTPR
jgi:hypothetical protein